MQINNNLSAQPKESKLPSPDTLARLAISESGFIFDPVTGHSFSVNETGILVIRLLQKGTALTDTVTHLQNTYQERAEVIERDLLEFISLLREQVDSGV